MPLSSLKQTMVILVVCVIGVLIASYAAYGNPFDMQKTAQQEATNAVVQIQDTGTPIATSTDWKKQFLSPGNSTIATLSKPSTPAKTEPETLTGQFGKKFFEQYLYLRQNNLSEDPTAVGALVKQTTDDLVDAAPLARVYDIREIKISTDSGLAAEKTYANLIGSAFVSYMPSRDPATIAMQALESEDQSKIKEVVAGAKAYASLRDNFLTISVPKSLASYHLSLVNGASAMAFASDGMTKVFTDPIQSVGALAVYEQSIGKLRDGVLDLKFYFSQGGVQFSSSDPASIFFNLTN